MEQHIRNKHGERADPNAPSPSKSWHAGRTMFGGVLMVVGALGFLVGVALMVGNFTGAFPTFPMAGTLVTAVAAPICWVGRTISFGAIKEEVKQQLGVEKRESLRSRNNRSPDVSFMRTSGIICLALGFVMLIMATFPIAFAENSAQVLLGVACIAAVPAPLVLAGIVLTRRAAAQAGPKSEAEFSDRFFRGASTVLHALGGFQTDRVKKPDPNGSRMDRLRAFDLNTLTVAGWLLVLGTGFCFVGGSILLLGILMRNLQEDLGPFGAVVVLVGFVFAVAFYFGGKLVLGALGVPIITLADSPSHAQSDPYAEVARIFAGFMCGGCPNQLLDLPTRPNTPASAWEEEMGNYARLLGWHVEVRNDDWLVFCPDCHAARGPSRFQL